MDKSAYKFIVFFSLLFFLILYAPGIAMAQFNQIWDTVVGEPDLESFPDDAGGSEDTGGSDEKLPIGIFKPPFLCNKIYGGSTYISARHVWEIDFNRVSTSRNYCLEDEGDSVRASAPGIVSQADRVDYGWVIIQHDGGYNTQYAHMKNIQVNVNDRVKLYQKIGEISNVSPDNIGPHLHYVHQRNNQTVQVKFDGKAHPASLPGNRNIPYCPGIGFVSCEVLY